MRLPGSLMRLANLGLRTSTLFLRFLLSFYIVKYLGYDAAGLYGLTVGVIGLTPAIIGWGLNYFVSREVVGHSPSDAIPRIRDRLFVTLCSLTAGTVLTILFATIMGQKLSLLHALIVILAWLETFALDLHLPLIGLEKSVQANILVFVRSALWVPVIIALGLVSPKFQNIDVVLLAWIAADVAAFGLLLYFARNWQLRAAIRSPVDYGWIRNRLGRSWYIYLSDLGIAGFIYIDRYIVSFMLGLAATGIYTFFWSLSNSLQTLVQTVVVQIALPHLVKAFPLEDKSLWRLTLRNELLKTAIFSTGLAVSIFVASELLLRFLSMQGLREHQGLFLLMLGAAVLRSCSDLTNIAITSTGRDRFYAATNIAGIFLSVGLSFGGIYLFGLEGAGLASLITAVILLGFRYIYLKKTFRSLDPPTAKARLAD